MTETLEDVIVAGLKTARDLRLTKDHDIATAVLVALNNAGLKIVRKPRR